VAIALAAVFLRSQWDELRSYTWRLHPGWLALSGLFMLASWTVEVAIWQRLLHILGGHLPYLAALRIWFLTAIVRYLPGNIWQPLSMTLYCQRWNIRPEATLTSIVLYQVILLLATGPVAALYFPLSNNWGLLTHLLNDYTPWLAALAILPVIAFLVRPSWLFDLVNLALRKAGRPALEASLSSSYLLFLLALNLLTWLLWGASFASLTYALRAYPVATMMGLAPHLIAVYAIGSAIGFISFFAPGGLGVREGAFYLLLTPLLGGGAATVVALAMRLWNMLGELVMAAVSALAHRQTVAYSYSSSFSYSREAEPE
jgi:uncharacterized membrane protein YbhN (UPF0104 family)